MTELEGTVSSDECNMAEKSASGDKNIMDWFSSAFGEFPCLLHSRKARELNSIRVQALRKSMKSNNSTNGDIGEEQTIKDCTSSNDDTNKGDVHTNQDSPKSGDDTKGDQGEVHIIQDSPKSGDDTKGDQGEVHIIQDSLKSSDDTKGDQGEVHIIQDHPKSGDDTKGDQVEVHIIQDHPKSGDDTKGDQVEVQFIQAGPKSGDEIKGVGEEENYVLINFSDTVNTNFHVYALLALKDEIAGREAWLAVQKNPFSIVARVNFAYFSCIINNRERAEKQLAWLLEIKNEDPEFFSGLLEDATHEVVCCLGELGWEMKTETITAAEEAIQKYPSNSTFKVIYALSLRRTLNPTYMSLHPEVDFARVLERAVEIYIQLMEDEKVVANHRALACAELGEIISLRYDSELDDAMKRIKQNLRYTASDCYELALELDMEEQGALWRAGKYFRNITREYDKSYKAIKRALLLCPNSVNYHQLGLTLKKLAISAKYYNKDYPGLLTYDPFPEKCKPEVNQGHIKQKTHSSSDDVSRNSNVLGEEMKQDFQDSAISSRKKDDLEHKPDNDDIEKVPEVNLRPCRGTFLPVCAQPTLQPGTTVMTGISVKRDIPDRVKLGWMWKSPLDSKTFSRVDRYVTETMEHFQKAVKLSLGDNTAAVYDLALMHKALGEYSEALDTFQQILKKNKDLSESVNAIEQTGLVLIELSKSAEREKEDDFIQIGKVILLMAIICQSRVLYRNRKFRNYNNEIWRDFFNLGLYIERQQRSNTFSDKVNAQEDWLIELIRRHSRGLQVLKDILNFNIMEASSVQFLESRIRRYVREGRYEDAMTFLALLKLTSHGQAESSFRDSDMSFKVYVHAARNRFLQVCKNKDTLKDIANSNMQVARWIFRWAFENKFDTLKTSSRSADTSQALPANNTSEIYHSEDVTDDKHVILLYDPEDEAGIECVNTLYKLLQRAFGLRAKPVTHYGLTHSPSDISLVLAHSPLLLVVLASKEVSTKFNDYINAAVNANKPVDSVAETLSVGTSRGNILALLTEDASLPPLLKEHRVLPYPQELHKFEVDMLKSREYVITICKFFCQLLNSDVEIT